jgi:outer membrane protein TolC
LRRPVYFHPMKIPRLFAAVPLFAMAWATIRAASGEVILPERLFPQLDAILKKAVQQSPRMLARALDLEIAENNRIAARAGMLPSIGAAYSYYKSKDKQAVLYDTPGSSSSPPPYTLTKTPYYASISQPIFHWGERRNNARIGEIQQNIAQGQYRAAYRLLAQTLRSDYMGLIVLKLSMNRAEFYRKILAEQLKQDEERLTKKVISEAEIFGVRINAERAQIASERAEFDLENARKAFARLAGMDRDFTNDDIPESIPETVYKADVLNQLLAEFLAQKEPANAEAFVLRKQLEIEDLTYKNARTRLWPKLNAAAGLSEDVQDNYFGGGGKYTVTSYYAGITLNWTIFDGFTSGAVVRNSLARRRVLENDYRQLTEVLAQDAQNQVKLVGFLARNMSITDRLLTSGEGNLNAKSEEFKRGVRAEIEVNQAGLSFYDAELNAYKARLDVLQSTGYFLGIIMDDPALANLTTK